MSVYWLQIYAKSYTHEHALLLRYVQWANWPDSHWRLNCEWKTIVVGLSVVRLGLWQCSTFIQFPIISRSMLTHNGSTTSTLNTSNRAHCWKRKSPRKCELKMELNISIETKKNKTHPTMKENHFFCSVFLVIIFGLNCNIVITC